MKLSILRMLSSERKHHLRLISGMKSWSRSQRHVASLTQQLNMYLQSKRLWQSSLRFPSQSLPKRITLKQNKRKIVTWSQATIQLIKVIPMSSQSLSQKTSLKTKSFMKIFLKSTSHSQSPTTKESKTMIARTISSFQTKTT